MNAKSQPCDDQQLLALLRDEHCDNERESLTSHVEQCTRCQARLEELAADAETWRKTSAALSSGELKADQPCWDANQASHRATRMTWAHPSWTESMAKQLLSPPSHPEMLGRLGRYEVERMVGAGGMGVVFKAHDSELHRPVAVKVLAPYLAGNGPARKRFAREARAAAAIVHEHVVPIHNVETERDAPFLVMQYIAGESLQTRIDRTGPLQTCQILRLGMQIASGLAAAHQQGLVHRDIKPSNILLEQGMDRALITDFGLARAADDATLTRSGFHPGTPQFMSPEQASGDPVDARSDLFSLGSVLYAMCTGRAPFRAESSLGVLRRITDDEPRRIRELNPGIPEWLCALIAKLMAKRPADRYSSATVVANLLEQCLAHVQQPEFIRLPDEVNQLQNDAAKSPFVRFLFQKARQPMTKIFVSLAALLALIAAYFLQSPPPSEALQALQGEWQLVASEKDGKTLPDDQLFNERLIIQGTKFSRPQTAPNGTELKGESGRVSIVQSVPGEIDNAIDFRVWEGTVHGVYKLANDKLVLCVTRQGGPRPDSFQTKAGDSRVLATYRRKKPSVNSNAPEQPGPAEEVRDKGPDRAWKEAWLTRIPKELSGSINRKQAQQWMRDQGFTNIEMADVTLEVMKRIHPDARTESIQRDGITTVVHGVLRSKHTKGPQERIEVYCLFGDADKLLALHVDPCHTEQPETPLEVPAQGVQVELADPQRFVSPLSRPVMAENATALACIGPEHPVRLGDMVSHADINAGLEPSVVRLHVWDWAKSDHSRVLLVQRSELGALSPDGGMMLTQEGETIDLSSKQTRQYSGFKVPEGQRIRALYVSPLRNYAAAVIHVRTDEEQLATDPPTVDVRHFWRVRLIKLDASTNLGHRLGEYPVNARPGIVFTADEACVIYSTDQHSIVRREISTGRILNTYEPTAGVQGAVGLAVSPDGRLVAAAGYHGTIYLWEAEKGVLRFQQDLSPAEGEPNALFRAGVLRFSPDSSKLAMVSGNHVKVIDTATGAVLREHRDATRPHYVHIHWSADGKAITLLTSSQASEYNVSPPSGVVGPFVSGRNADRLPRIYEWTWDTGAPEVKRYAANNQNPIAHIDPDMETRRLTGTWRVVDRITAGVEQKDEIGQTLHSLHGRMGEVVLKLDPNKTPRTVDVVYLEGPEKGKVLRGIYEWIPDWKPNSSEQPLGTGEALRICTFVEPHPHQPDARPSGFQAGKDVDTAIWACLSHQRPNVNASRSQSVPKGAVERHAEESSAERASNQDSGAKTRPGSQ